MNALYMVVLCLIQSAVLTGCCSVKKINLTVDNASILCTTDRTCVAECYRGFIFSSGKTKQSYSCLNGVWSPVLSTCKRIPVIYVTYSVIWKINNVVPSNCANVSKRLSSTAEMLEERLSSVCSLLTINSTVNFTYSMNGSLVNANFTAVYRNYTTRRILNICIDYTVLRYPHYLNFTTMFNAVTCKGSNLSNTIYKSMYVSERLEYCLNGTEVQNVTTSYMYSPEMEQYCDFKDKATSIERITQGNSTSLSTSDFSIWINMHQTTNGGFVEQIPSDISKRRTSIYILVPAAGIVLISGIVTLVVCRRKRAQAQEREKSYETIIREEQTQYINMADITHHYDVIGYRDKRIQESRS